MGTLSGSRAPARASRIFFTKKSQIFGNIYRYVFWELFAVFLFIFLKLTGAFFFKKFKGTFKVNGEFSQYIGIFFGFTDMIVYGMVFFKDTFSKFTERKTAIINTNS